MSHRSEAGSSRRSTTRHFVVSFVPNAAVNSDMTLDATWAYTAP